MEKTQQLQKINNDICSYYQQFSTTKMDEVLCFKQDKKQLSQFYSTMNEQMLEQKIRKNQEETQRKLNRQKKIKNRILSALNNPLKVSLPKQVPQDNLITTETISSLKTKYTPRFFGGEGIRRGSYAIGDEVRQIVSQDIKKMQEQKEERQFRKKYSQIRCKTKGSESINAQKTQEMIKTYNKIISKYKNQQGMDELKLIDQFNYPELIQELVVDNQFFNVLGLFKKLYFQTKSKNINDGLLKYILKFQKFDKMSKKVKSKNGILIKKTLSKQSSNFGQNTEQLFRRKSSGKPFSIHKNVNRKSVISQNYMKENNSQQISKSTFFKTKMKSTKQDLLKNERIKLRL